MSEAIRIARPAGFVVFSTALHILIAASCGLFSSPASSKSPPARDLIDISVEPALGKSNGSAQGKGLGSRIAQGDHRQHHSTTARVNPAANDPNAIPTSPVAAAKAQSLASASPAPQPGIASTAPAGDPASPVGSANVAAAIGRTDGSENGVGMGPPKARMTPQYKGMLAGWFAARFTT